MRYDNQQPTNEDIMIQCIYIEWNLGNHTYTMTVNLSDEHRQWSLQSLQLWLDGNKDRIESWSFVDLPANSGALIDAVRSILRQNSTYLVIQKGYVIFGHGYSKEQAVEDMKRWVDSSSPLQEATPEDIQDSYHQANDGDMVLVESTPELLETYSN